MLSASLFCAPAQLYAIILQGWIFHMYSMPCMLIMWLQGRQWTLCQNFLYRCCLSLAPLTWAWMVPAGLKLGSTGLPGIARQPDRPCGKWCLSALICLQNSITAPTYCILLSSICRFYRRVSLSFVATLSDNVKGVLSGSLSSWSGGAYDTCSIPLASAFTASGSNNSCARSFASTWLLWQAMGHNYK